MTAPNFDPVVDRHAVPFFEAARRGELVIPRCPETGTLFFPPRARSPYAPERPHEWQRVSGRGEIWSFAVPHPPLLPPFTDVAPYAFILVALEEAPHIRLPGNLVPHEDAPINAIDPATIEIGTPVEAHFEPAGESAALLRWTPRR